MVLEWIRPYHPKLIWKIRDWISCLVFSIDDAMVIALGRAAKTQTGALQITSWRRDFLAPMLGQLAWNFSILHSEQKMYHVWAALDPPYSCFHWCVVGNTCTLRYIVWSQPISLNGLPTHQNKQTHVPSLSFCQCNAPWKCHSKMNGLKPTMCVKIINHTSQVECQPQRGHNDLVCW